MACNLAIDFTIRAALLTANARAAITGAGGEYSGDASAGSFGISTPVGRVRGDYTVTGQTIHVTISEKPFLVSCQKIESELRKHMGV